MTDDQRITPTRMLKAYREQSGDELREQAQALRMMRESDRDELLFYMVVHLTVQVKEAGQKLDALLAALETPAPESGA